MTRHEILLALLGAWAMACSAVQEGQHVRRLLDLDGSTTAFVEQFNRESGNIRLVAVLAPT